MPWLHLGFSDNTIIKNSTAKVTLIPIKVFRRRLTLSCLRCEMWLVCALNVAWYDPAAKIVVKIYFSFLMLKFDLREFASLVIITFRKFVDFKRSRTIFFKNAIKFVKRTTVYAVFFAMFLFLLFCNHLFASKYSIFRNFIRYCLLEEIF